MTKPIRLIAAVLAVITLGPTSAAFASDGPPIVVTNPTTLIGNQTAQFNGWVDANGKDTTVLFDYGTTTGYGQTSGSTVIAHDRSATVFHRASGLTPGTVYHVRLRATNSKGTTSGADQTFTTTDSPCTGSGVVGASTGGAGVPGSVGAGVAGAGAGAAGAGAVPVVVNVWSAPEVVPFEFVARRRTW